MREIKRSHQILLALVVVAVGALLHRAFQEPPDGADGAGAADSGTATGGRGAAESLGTEAPPGESPGSTTDASGDTAPPMAELLVARVEAALARPQGVQLKGQVVDPTREPLPGAQVEALSLEVRSLAEGPRPRVLGRAQAGPDGRFVLTLQAGLAADVILRLRHEAHALRRLPLGPLAADAVRDLGVVVLEPGFVAHGVVRSEDDGGPIAGARLSFLPEELVGQPDAEGRVVTSDEQGRFLARGVSSDLVRVEVESRGHARTRVAMVSLLPEVEERNAMDLRLVKAHSLDGFVRDRFGRMVADARVIATRIGALSTCEAGTRSEASGAFRFEDLEEGYYVLKVRHPDHAELVHPRVHTGVSGLELRLDPLGSVSLTLPDVPDDRPVPVAVVPIHGATGQAMLPALGRSAERGVLVVDGLDPGTWSLELRVPGTAPTRTGSFEVYAGRETRLGVVRLAAPAAIQGRVVDGEGRPLAARIALCSPFLRETLAPRRSLFQLADRRLVQTDAGGLFELPDLAGGPTGIAVQAPGHQEWRRLDLPVTAGGVLDLGDVVLEPAATLTGRVLGPGGEGVAGVLVDLTGTSDTRHTTSDGEGYYEFRDLAPGAWVVSVAAGGSGEEALADALSGAHQVQHRVQLEAGEATQRDLGVRGRAQRLP